MDIQHGASGRAMVENNALWEIIKMVCLKARFFSMIVHNVWLLVLWPRSWLLGSMIQGGGERVHWSHSQNVRTRDTNTGMKMEEHFPHLSSLDFPFWLYFGFQFQSAEKNSEDDSSVPISKQFKSIKGMLKSNLHSRQVIPSAGCSQLHKQFS